MDDFLLAMGVLILLSLAGGLVRILRGPTPADRMVAAQLFGTAGTALLLTLAEAVGAPALRDVALVIVLLAAVAAMAFVLRYGERETRRP
ncbi:MAG TPA: monovalent cation/H+ antiporter complex subunit F [Pelomicrobium sp.]|nr:monovalent cation/H+ antiporter complex subunit F [Pelomicrobium sp.]